MVKQFDHYLDNIQFILLSILVKLGPFFVALMPASFMGWSILVIFLKSLETFRDSQGNPLNPFLIFIVSFSFAIVTVVSVETVGIIVVHVAADLWDFVEQGKVNPIKFKLMVFLIPVYVLSISLVVGLSDAFPPLVRNIGIVSPLLTVISYTAITLKRSLLNIQLKESEDKKLENLKIEESKGLVKEKAKADWELEKEKALLTIQLKHQEKLKKLELKSQGQVSEVKNRTLVKEENKTKLLEILAKPGKHTVQEISDSLGVSRVTVYTYMEELSSQVKYNGNGVELIKEEIREF